MLLRIARNRSSQGGGSIVEGGDQQKAPIVSDSSDSKGRSAGQHEPDGVDIRFMVRVIWRGKWILLVLLLIGLYQGFVKLQGFQPTYEASLTILPTNDQFESGGGTDIAGVARGLGISVKERSATPIDRLQLTIGSIELARRLDEKYDLTKRIFSGSWDERTEAWIRPSGFRFDLEQRIRSQLNLSTWAEPTIETLARYLGSAIEFKDIKKGAFKRVSFSHSDPEAALEYLTLVYFEADNVLREGDQLAAVSRKAYLESRLRDTNIAESRSMLTALLSGEERRLMLLRSDLPYAAQLVEAPYASRIPSAPQLLDTLVVPAFTWLLIGSVILVLVAVFRQE